MDKELNQILSNFRLAVCSGNSRITHEEIDKLEKVIRMRE